MVTLLGAALPRGEALQNSLIARPLKLATIRPGSTCRVTQGSREIVPPLDYIFGSGGVWFGDGPVYVNLAWKGDRLPPARFTFNLIPVHDGKPWPAKTPVTAEPGFTGDILIRGRSLDDRGAALMFRGDTGPVDHLVLQAPHGGPAPNTWSFWATGMIVPHAGCYGLQIDTQDRTEVMTFEATP
jgi:hypothetical protein